MTRRKEFKVLSDGQKDTIAQVLGRLHIVSIEMQTAIKASQTAITAHLTVQDTSSKQSETRVMRRFDSLDAVTKDAA